MRSPGSAPRRAPQVISELRPGPDEVVLPKTTSSVFSSTTIDYILRNMGRDRHLILAGALTDQCVVGDR